MANRNEEIEKRLQATFRIEAEGHLQAINAELDSLVAESVSPDVAHTSLETLFRTMHTLKGAARSVGFSTVEALCQRCEAVLSDATKRRIEATPEMFAVLRDATDGLAVLLVGPLPPDRLDKLFDALGQFSGTSLMTPSAGAATKSAPPRDIPPLVKQEAPAARPAATAAPRPPPLEPPPPSASPEPAPPAVTESIRVEVSRLDRLVTLTEDLLIPKLVAGERMRLARELLNGMRHLRTTLPTLLKSAPSLQHSGVADETDAADILAGVEAMAQRLSLSLAEDYKSLSTVVDNLVGETRRARMMPASSILEAFPRMVRDLCRETGKDVTWRVTGADVELDRKILDIVKDPLIHMVRNAVDHGIEAPNDRVAAGKPARGNVALHIESLDEGHVRIEIADDGQGMEMTDLKDAALRSRTMTPDEIGILDETAVLDLAFRAGVSTSPVISSLSGHGLGLSIVRERVERLDGKVRIAKSSAQGTTIQIDLPVSIATYRGLLVDVGGIPLLWPLDSVERAIGVSAEAMQEALSTRLYVYENETLPFVRLAPVLGLNRQTLDRQEQAGQKKTHHCIVAKAAGKRGVFLVDGIAGEHEVLIKDLQSPLRRLRNIAAVGLMGTGELVLVLRPTDILHSMHLVETERDAEFALADVRTRRILVVDDSITTRTMERNLFESAGYRVRVAADGLEAWNLLQVEEIDLVVSDIDMPRMNGFELTARIRSEQKTVALPIVLVTALESREDKKRGIEVGANAYVLKSTFDQSNLIEIVGRLL